MPIDTIISPEAIVPLLRGTSERSVTSTLAKKASNVIEIDSSQMSDAIRSQTPSALQHLSTGAAILHITLPNQKTPRAVFARLATRVEFTTAKDEPFDLILLLVTGESKNNQHLQLLAEISRLFRDRSLCDKLRGSTTSDAIYALLTGRSS
ncbi:MAG: hypothetical protein CMM32_04490 [Rhodospirillaceae bacterium]|nr:hypothetical protein [Rhodospirillaceae bacterium]|tara:strand:- start:1906 stop:2358 length:453 start_codon:yes stop_codon:yes gene_type:complete